MPTTYSESIERSTYKDDYDAAKGYHKVLFNSGRALQARELNQLQTIIQKEIGRLGAHLFKTGAAVKPGGINVNNRYEYVRLNPNVGSPSSDLVGKTLTSGSSPTITAEVVQWVPGSGIDGDTTNVPTIFVVYKDTTPQASDPNVADNSGPSAARFAPSDVLSVSGGGSVAVEASNTSPIIWPVGAGSKIGVGAGTYFVMGHFVEVPKQALILRKYATGYTGDIGFKVFQDIVTAADSNLLYDNQGSVPNLTSPGADRYRIRLKLTRREDCLESENFIFLCRVANGAIANQVTGLNEYNKINDVLAQRTKEESGNYIVDPFKIRYVEIDSAATPDRLYLEVSKGIAYINGYRAENPTLKKIPIPKPTAVETIEGDGIPVVYDRYFNGNSTDKGTHRGTLPLNSTAYLYDDDSAQGSVLAKVKIRSIERSTGAVSGVNSVHRIYIASTGDISSNIRTARSIGDATGTNYYRLVLEGNPPRALIKGQQKNKDLLFTLSRPRPSIVGDLDYDFIFQQSFTNGDTLDTNEASVNFTDTSSWIVSSTDSGSVPFTVTTQANGLSAPAGQATISGLTTVGGTYTVTGYKAISNAAAKEKKPNRVQITGTVTAGTPFSLGEYDIRSVSEIKDSANGQSIFSYFTLDNGQRDTHYAKGRLIPTFPYSGPIFVDFQYWQRGSLGSFYSRSSYKSNPTPTIGGPLNIVYNDIPSYKPNYDKTTRLYNVIDLRPDFDSVSGTFDNGTDKFYLPQRSSIMTGDNSYYLPRADKLAMSQGGKLMYIRGVPSRNPQFKKTPDDALDLYKIVMNANTLTPEDVSITKIEARRYTMKDIGKIEKKLDRLEEVTTLSLLELDTKNLSLLDADGNVRTKSGFFVENFKDQTLSATTAKEYRAALDFQGNLLRPKFTQDNIRLLWDSVSSAGVVKKGDMLLLDYAEVDWKSVQIASRTESVNPFIINIFEGFMDLSPASDEWKETKYKAPKIIPNGTRIESTDVGFIWNEHETNWAGQNPDDKEVGQVTGVTSSIAGSETNVNTTSTTQAGDGLFTESVTTDVSTAVTTTTTKHTVTKIVAEETVEQVVGDRIVQVFSIPWMRSRKIYFKAEGMRPNIRVYPFFNNKNVSKWCRQEDFVRWSERSEDVGNNFTKYESHPDGSTPLVANQFGEVSGSFVIPRRVNTRQYYNTILGVTEYDPAQDVDRFPCGSLEFKLLDVNQPADQAATSKAFAIYTAAGSLNQRQRDVLSTRVLYEATADFYSESVSVSTSSSTSLKQNETTANLFTETLSAVEDMQNEIADLEQQIDILGEEIDNIEITNITNITVEENIHNTITNVTNVNNEYVTNVNNITNEITVQTENSAVGSDVGHGGESGIGSTASGTTTLQSIEINAEGDNGSQPTQAAVVFNVDNGGEAVVGTANSINVNENYQIQTDGQYAEQSSTVVEPGGGSASGTDYQDQKSAPVAVTTNESNKSTTTNSVTTFNVDEVDLSAIASLQNLKTFDNIKLAKGYVDPIAQTFMVDNEYGAFLTKVGIFFCTKDPDIPVQVQIRPTVNGAPSSTKIMASKYVAPSQVLVPAVEDRRNMTAIKAAETIFEFEEPVFLSPFTEYAICVIAPNTPKYTVYVSEMEQWVLGSTDQRILTQPSLGSFFKSQNSQIWEPDQNVDLMYKTYRAHFRFGGKAVFTNAVVPRELLDPDPINTTQGSTEVYISHYNHGLTVGDEAEILGLDSASRYGGGAGILGSSLLTINGTRRTVTKADAFGYTFDMDSVAPTTSTFGGNEITSDRNIQFNVANLVIETANPDFTSVSAGYKFTAGKPIAGPTITTGPNVQYNKDTDWQRITPKINTSFDYPRVCANRYNEVTEMSSVESVEIKVDMKSSHEFVSPMLDLQRCSLIMIENIIDYQDSADTSGGKNIPIRFTSETDPYSGSHPAKHITKPITLAEDAVGLKILYAANVPGGAKVDLYYRTAVEGENITEKNWVYDAPENTLPTDENPAIFREYTNLVGGDDGDLDAFTEFQIKLVLRSLNSSKVPMVRDLRAIALVD